MRKFAAICLLLVVAAGCSGTRHLRLLPESNQAAPATGAAQLAVGEFTDARPVVAKGTTDGRTVFKADDDVAEWFRNGFESRLGQLGVAVGQGANLIVTGRVLRMDVLQTAVFGFRTRYAVELAATKAGSTVWRRVYSGTTVNQGYPMEVEYAARDALRSLLGVAAVDVAELLASQSQGGIPSLPSASLAHNRRR